MKPLTIIAWMESKKKERSGMHEFTLPVKTIIQISGTLYRLEEEAKLKGRSARLTIWIPPAPHEYTFPKDSTIYIEGQSFELQHETRMMKVKYYMTSAEVPGAPVVEPEAETTQRECAQLDPPPEPAPPPQDTTGPD